MKRFEQTFNLAWVLLSLGICVKSISLTLWGPAGAGSGLIPFVSGFFMGVIGLALLVREAVSKRGTGPKIAYWTSPTAGKRVLFLLLGLCVMAFLMPRLGFFLTSILVTAFMLQVIEPQKWWAALATSLVSCVAVYLLFVYLLDIRLPKGFLGI